MRRVKCSKLSCDELNRCRQTALKVKIVIVLVIAEIFQNGEVVVNLAEHRCFLQVKVNVTVKYFQVFGR